MDRTSLEQLLGQGLSLAEIGRQVDLHEATVSYWIKKYGLRAANREKHVARGGIAREELQMLVEAGMSTSQIAEVVGCSKTTVRHWLREYGLKTQWAERRHASKDCQPQLMLRCARHGLTVFRRRSSGGYRCAKCRSEAVARRRRKVKQVLVDEAGGRCSVCGYNHCVGALEFHHLVPAEKSFAMSHRGVARSLAKARLEAGKCVLLCANCHAEVEAGIIPPTSLHSAHVQCRSGPAVTKG
jgi:transposase